MKAADTLLYIYFALLVAGSGYYFYRFWVHWAKGNSSDLLVQPLPLKNSEFLSFLVGFCFLFFYAQQWVIYFSLFSIFILFLVKGLPLLDFWKIEWTKSGRFLAQAGKTYLAIFLPLTLVTALCSMILSIVGFEDVSQPAIQAFMNAKDLPSTLVFIFFASVVAPVWEEITFRGFLYPYLKSKMNYQSALLVSGLLFALMHQHAPSFIPLTLLGVCLGLVFERTGSLISCIFLHALFNLATCIVLLLIKYGSHPEWVNTM